MKNSEKELWTQLKDRWERTPYANPILDFVFFYIFHKEENLHMLKSLINSIFQSLGEELIEVITVVESKLAKKSKDGMINILDVNCITQDKKKINIEMQLTTKSWLPNRMTAQSCKLFEEQFSSSVVYETANPIYSIWIFPFSFSKISSAIGHYTLFDKLNNRCLFESYGKPGMNVITIELSKILDRDKNPDLILWRDFFIPFTLKVSSD